MAWIDFKLGRPGSEYTFTLNPRGMDIEDGPVAGRRRNLVGDLKKSTVKTSAPTIRLSSDYLTKAQRDQFMSLSAITDTFLSFQIRNDLQVLLERNLPASVTTVVIQNTSATRLAAALVAAAAASSITITGVFDNAAGTGTNYYTAGSYAAATRTVTLGTPVADATAYVYVTYTYTGWLVDLARINTRAEGGWVDRFQYDFELQGA